MDSERIEQLVAEFIERRENGEDVTPATFAAQHPALEHELQAEILATLEAMELFPDGEAAVPESIGGYRVLRELGRGGMGVVYEVERDGIRYALKALPLAAGPRALDRLRREAQALRRLDHPGIVTIRDTGTEHGTPYLVMDVVDGRSLADLEDAIDPHEAARIVRDLSRTVAAAHERGVLHRDIKPQNAVLRHDGSVVLVDFGLGTVAGEPTLTATGDLLGTPRYMAPEQASGADATEQSDVYGLGLVLFELVTGRPARDSTSRTALVEAAILGHVPDPRTHCDSCPPDLARIIVAALAKEESSRLRSAAQLAEQLTLFLEGRTVTFRARRRVRWQRIAVGGMVAALLSTIVLLAFSGDDGNTVWAADARDSMAAGRVGEALRIAWDRYTEQRGARPDALFQLLDHLDQIEDVGVLETAARELVAARPNEGDRHLLLAYVLDCDHRVRAAAKAYAASLDRDPTNAYAHVLAANLHAGGNPACAGCEKAFADAPELVDHERAVELLLAALRRDQGATDRILVNVVHIGQTIDRGGVLGAEIDRLIAAGRPGEALDRLKRARARISRSAGR